MRKLLLICLIPLISNGCSLLPLKNYLFIDIKDNYYPNQSVIFKSIPHTWDCDGSKETWSDNTPAQYPRKYIFISVCHMEPFDYIPETITIEYAPWLTDEEQEAKGLSPKNEYIIGDRVWNGRVTSGSVLGENQEAIKYNATVLPKLIDEEVDKIQPNQWHKIVLHPQELVKKYKGVTPDGEGMRSAGKEISYSITLNKDGTYKVEDSVSWRTPISHNWAN